MSRAPLLQGGVRAALAHGLLLRPRVPGGLTVVCDVPSPGVLSCHCARRKSRQGQLGLDAASDICYSSFLSKAPALRVCWGQSVR